LKIEGLIAVRYLFSRKQRSVVNVISWISLVGLMVSTTALIVVLSVYNGIGDITKDLFGTFDPELSIEPAHGKTIHTATLDLQKLRSLKDVDKVSCLVSETAWITHGQNQAIVKLRGVDEHYAAVTGIDTLILHGSYTLGDPNTHTLIVGGQIFHDLAMTIPSSMPVAVHIPKRGTTAIGHTTDEAFNIGYAYPVANFFIQQDIDRQYVVTDIDFVRQLMRYEPDEVTSVALKLKAGADPDEVKEVINSTFQTPDSELIVKDRYDQQPLYFKIYRTERLGIYLILSLIIFISTLSLVASLSLLILNKKDDIFMLRSMGMERRNIRHAFLLEGLLICATAVVAGLVMGFLICFLQQQFGIIGMGDGNFVVPTFPVAMRAVDFLTTFLLVMAISALSVSLTVRRARI
jgi:lipoprotein-releasing system permease protein